LVVIPTDTVYGVACSPFKGDSIARLFEAKNRPQEKAIQVLLADVKDALLVAKSVPPLAEKLAARFWPGALTMTLPKRDGLPPNLSVYDTVGVRIPDHDSCRTLIRAVGGALAATSANRSGGANPTTVDAAYEALGDAVSVYLDGGQTAGDRASTVIALHEDGFTILREGPVTRTMLEAALR
jgi:tRNA threonylcarbamoyl adenosine modification protein (Sua5/YciO/YrdC/YwlC family)